MQQNNSAPPLRIWLALLFIVFFCVAVVYVFQRRMQAADYPAKVAYLLQRYQERSGRPVILVLGSSMTQCALDSTESLENMISDGHCRKPVVIKIWKPAASVGDMIASMPQLRTVHPDILVIEANMLFYLPDDIPLDSRMYSAFNQLARGHLRQRYLPDVKPNRSMLEGNKSMDAYRKGPVDSNQMKLLADLAAYYRASGTRILVVNIPLRPREEATKWQSRDTNIFRSNLGYLMSKVPVKYLCPQLRWSDSCFIDKGHMNARGCSIYSEWFVNAMTNCLHDL